MSKDSNETELMEALERSNALTQSACRQRDAYMKQNAGLLEALRQANELLELSDVQYTISHKLGEQARLHKALGLVRKAIRTATEGQTK